MQLDVRRRAGSTEPGRQLVEFGLSFDGVVPADDRWIHPVRCRPVAEEHDIESGQSLDVRVYQGVLVWEDHGDE